MIISRLKSKRGASETHRECRRVDVRTIRGIRNLGLRAVRFRFPVALIILGAFLLETGSLIAQEKESKAITQLPALDQVAPIYSHDQVPPQVVIRPSASLDCDLHEAGFQIQVEPLRNHHGQYRMSLSIPASIREIEITPRFNPSKETNQIKSESMSLNLGDERSKLDTANNALPGQKSSASLIFDSRVGEPKTEGRANRVGGNQVTRGAFLKNPYFEKAQSATSIERDFSNAYTSPMPKRVVPDSGNYVTTCYEAINSVSEPSSLVSSSTNSNESAQRLASYSMEMNKMGPIRMRFSDIANEEFGVNRSPSASLKTPVHGNATEWELPID